MRLIAAAVLSFLASFPAFSGPFTNVYFFGDSLTDTGNVTTVYASLHPGAPPVPGFPYDPEGRASNGLLYADILAAGLTPTGVTPNYDATASERGGDNYAFGGARTRYQIFGPEYDGLITQVQTYIAKPGSADPHALYVVWGGANNLQDILLGRTTDIFGNPIPGVGATIGDLVGILNSLYLEGARNFLVPNAPNLGRVPRVRELDKGLGGPIPGAITGATNLTIGFNAGLKGQLDLFEATHPDVDLIQFNTFAALENIFANAANLGLTNLTGRCYTGDDLTFTGGGTVCSNPESFVFWDGIHPTATVHNILGSAMLIAVVPEPGSFALLGLGLAGLVWSRRKK